MRAPRFAAGVAVFALGLASCSSDQDPPAASGGAGFVGLRSSAAPTLFAEDRSCDEVLEDFQSFAPTVLRDQFGFGFGTVDVAMGGPVMESVDDSAGSAEPSAAPAADRASNEGTGAAPAGASSDTNTQEAGIDEPDVVETDGRHVFVVDQDELVILDGASGAVVSRLRLASHGAQLLLQGDRLLAITGGGYGFAVGRPAIAVDDIGEPEPRPIDPPQFAAGTVLQLIDVADRAAPRILQTTELEGNHVTTRVVDGVARVVISSWPQPPVPMADLPAFSGGIDEGEAMRAVEDAISAELASTTIDDWLPRFRTTMEDGRDGSSDDSTIEGPLVECEQMLVPEINAGITETSILRVDFEDGFDPAHTTTVVAEAGTVYASAATLYLAANKWVPATDQQGLAAEDWSTAIHAFDLGGTGAATHVGAGEVPGSTLNQYSLSEFDGHLRIATTEGTPWGGGTDSESGVRVLRLDGDQLVEVGAVTGLGKTETIQSVRFMGPVGYVVTFRQTDPLYVIDLSDPAAPAAVGELKIPGFSSYLHPVGEGRLIGVGRDADLEGRDQGLLVSLFDVSDPTAPKQIQTYTERDARTAAGNDPKAFLWWAPESAMVVSVERYGRAAVESGLEGDYDVGMAVLDVDDSAITERATVRVDGRYPLRAVVVQDRLWSLFDGGAYVSDFSDPTAGSFTGYR